MEFENFDLDSVLEQPTQNRTQINNDTEITSFSNLEFEEVEEIPVAVDDVEIELPYDAETNAEILVGLLDVVNTQTCTPLARWKLRKKQGGRKKVTEMQLLFERQTAGDELTKEEKQKVSLYSAYLKDKKELESAIPYTDEEKNNLKMSAIPYLQSTKMKIGGGAAFFTQLAMIQGSRIVSILTV